MGLSESESSRRQRNYIWFAMFDYIVRKQKKSVLSVSAKYKQMVVIYMRLATKTNHQPTGRRRTTILRTDIIFNACKQCQFDNSTRRAILNC